jgi:hypothetical protein
MMQDVHVKLNKATFNRKETLLTSKLDLNLGKKLIKVLHLKLKVRENQNTHFIFINCFPKIVPFMR